MATRQSDAARPPYLWIPGNGPDPEALARLTLSGPRPSVALQKAWFFGEPTFYPELLDRDPHKLPSNSLGTYLREISSAASCMGLRGEWLHWLHYLLPRLIPCALEYPWRDPRGRKLIARFPYGELVSAFMVMYPDDDLAGSDLADDVLGSLGMVLMKPAFWEGHGSSATWRHDEGDACIFTSDLYAGIFLHLKYLRVDRVSGWTRSLLEMSDPRWRAMLMEWMLGSARYLRGEANSASQLWKKHAWDLEPGWDGSESIGGGTTLSSEANRQEFCRSLRECLTESLVLEWFDSFATVEGLEEELKDWPERFVGEFFPTGAPTANF